MEAERYTKKNDAGSVRWVKVDALGKTLLAMTILPVTAPNVTPPADSPSLEYRKYLFTPGKAQVNAMLSPSLNFDPARGVRLAASYDGQAPQIVEAIPKKYVAGDRNRDLGESVKNSSRTVKPTLKVDKPGYHTLKLWMVDPAVVLQKIVVDMGGTRPAPRKLSQGGRRRRAPVSTEP
jgi:hypothetical protein